MTLGFLGGNALRFRTFVLTYDRCHGEKPLCDFNRIERRAALGSHYVWTPVTLGLPAPTCHW
jgi:hypothetical protein